MQVVDTNLKLKQSTVFGFNPRGTCQTAAAFGAAEAVTPAARQQTRVYLCFRKDLWLPAVFVRRVYKCEQV